MQNMEKYGGQTTKVVRGSHGMSLWKSIKGRESRDIKFVTRDGTV